MAIQTHPIRVALVDDDRLVHEAIRRYLSIAPDLCLVGTYSSPGEALDGLAQAPADVVLMDLNMPEVGGVEATELIRRACSDTRLLILTSWDDDLAVRAALKAGATGFVLKRVTPEALAEAVRAVHTGLTVLTTGLSGATPSGAAVMTEDLELSDREREILRLLCHGASNAEISAQLYLSESSVKAHMTSLMKRLGVTTRLKAVVRAHQLGLDGY